MSIWSSREGETVRRCDAPSLRETTGFNLLGVYLQGNIRDKYSVFEVSVQDRAELDRLCQHLRDIADQQSEVRLYRICANCREDSHLLDGQRIAQMPEILIL